MTQNPAESQFPFFNVAEQSLIATMLAEAPKKSQAYTDAKSEFLEILKKELIRYYQWDTTPDERTKMRQRLLNITGMFNIIPVEELKDLAHKSRLSQKKVVYEKIPDPIATDGVEIYSYDIKYLSGFSDFLSRILMEPDLSALDYISGNREKGEYPRSQITVFRKKLQDEVISAKYITGSAEPLTQTQIISLYNQDGTIRDLITIGHDMIFESAFIDFYHNGTNVTSSTLVRHSQIMGKHFLQAAVNEVLLLQKNRFENLNNLIYWSASPATNNLADLLTFVSKILIPQLSQNISQLNTQLKLKANDENIYWMDEKNSEDE